MKQTSNSLKQQTFGLPGIDWGLVGGLGSQAINAIDMIDGERSRLGGALSTGASMAGTGASIGALLGPGGAAAGAIIGGAVGLGSSLLGDALAAKRKEQMERELLEKNRELSTDLFNMRSRTALNTIGTQGVTMSNFAGYEYGGGVKSIVQNWMKPHYNVENNEVAIASQPPIATNGGTVRQLSSNTYKYEGNSHDNGGIDIAGGGDFIYSDKLQIPKEALKMFKL